MFLFISDSACNDTLLTLNWLTDYCIKTPFQLVGVIGSLLSAAVYIIGICFQIKESLSNSNRAAFTMGCMVWWIGSTALCTIGSYATRWHGICFYFYVVHAVCGITLCCANRRPLLRDAGRERNRREKRRLHFLLALAIAITILSFVIVGVMYLLVSQHSISAYTPVLRDIGMLMVLLGLALHLVPYYNWRRDLIAAGGRHAVSMIFMYSISLAYALRIVSFLCFLVQFNVNFRDIAEKFFAGFWLTLFLVNLLANIYLCWKIKPPKWEVVRIQDIWTVQRELPSHF